jgi:hypothetical protein
MSLRELIERAVRCGICGKAGYMTCACWEKCSKCGWLYERGGTCRNKDCGGNGALFTTHHDIDADDDADLGEGDGI